MNLKEIMKSKKITQRDLAKKMKLSQAIVSNWCTGYRKPSLKHLPTLSKLLGISMKELVNILLKNQGGD